MGSTGRKTGARRWGALAGAAALTVLGGAAPTWAAAPAGHHSGSATATPVKHLVVLFDENISFDHYFATYPQAANTDGTKFTPSPRTPRDIDNLRTAGLLDKNPNQYLPKRLGPDQAMTCDQNHSYGPEQYAYNGGKADKFVENTDSGKCSGHLFGEPGLAMDYFDGNTVTAMWNYAQHYALNDNSFGSAYGPRRRERSSWCRGRRTVWCRPTRSHRPSTRSGPTSPIPRRSPRRMRTASAP